MKPRHSPLVRARLGARIALAIALLLALPASAAQVVEVRVGTHPTFTRVVFQLDEAAGYRITRSGGERDPQITVTLDAAAEARSLRSGGDIRTVRVEGGAPAVAHIALRQPGLRVKEMMLTNPPRIVLDIMRAAPAETAQPRAQTPTPAPKPAEPKTAVSKPKPPAAQPKPEPPARKPTPTPEPQRAAAPKPAPKPAPPAPVAQLPPAPQPAAPTPAPTPTRPQPLPRRSEAPPTVPVKPSPAKPVPSVPSVPPAPRAAAKPGLAEQILNEPVWIGAAAGVLVVAIVAFVLIRRRRALPNDIDVAAVAEGDEDGGRIPAGGFAMGEMSRTEATAQNEAAPLSSLFDDTPAPRSSAGGMDAEAGDFAPPAAAAAGSSLFDQPGAAASQGEPRMTQDLDLPAARSAGPPPPPAAPAPGGDVARLLQELERRVIALESKLDESNEAREKLERQVAAQSEELRVQRAAIARTQRALRTMSRADEDKATEPALRDGETQSATRVKV